MIRRVFLPALMAAGLATSVQAQSPVAQAGSHVQFALTQCLENYRQPDALHAIFTAQGYEHVLEDWGGGEVAHNYLPVDRTAAVSLRIYDPSEYSCTIHTTHIGVEQMLPFARSITARVLNGTAIADGSPEGENILPGSPAAASDGCSGFYALVPQNLIWVKLYRAGNDGSCASDGTSQLVVLF